MHNLLKILFNSTYKISVTVDYVRQSLTKSFEELKEVSASTISRTLKHRWGMSYKKLSKANPKIFNEEKYRQILQSAALLQKLRNSNIEMIYLDEFSFDPRKTKFYGWDKKNSKKFISWFPEMKTMSFVIGLSQKQFYGMLGKQGTINSDVFKYYLQGLIKQLNSANNSMYDSAKIIWDNAVIHKSRIIKTFLSNNSVGILNIYPYCPFLNPIETLIGVVKNKIRVIQKHQR